MDVKRVFVISGPTRNSADDILDRLQALADDTTFDIDSAAVIRKDADGNVTIDDKDDVVAAEGALAGAIAGGVIGAIMGSIPGAIVGAASGAATGGASAAAFDFSLDKDVLHTIGERLVPNSSALLVVVDNDYAEVFETNLVREFGSTVKHTYQDIKGEVIEKWHELRH